MTKQNAIQNSLERLKTGVQDVYQSEKWKEMLTFFSSNFKQYSFQNSMLIWSQMPSATAVAGMKKWGSLGRKVKKGEKALRILMPNIKEVEVDVTDANGITTKKTEKKLVGFFEGSVFDVSQTEGAPLPTVTPTLVGNDCNVGELYSYLRTTAPIPVEEKDDLIGYGEYDHEKQVIRIRSDAPAEQKFKTLVHEVAHHILHAPQKGKKGVARARRIREIEAESVAYVVANYFGVDTSAYSFGYIAQYAHKAMDEAEMEALFESGRHIKEAAKKIIDIIDQDVD